MEAAGRNEGVAGQDPVAVPRLADVDARQAVEPVGEGACEMLRHMLYDHNARRIGGQRAQQFPQSLGAAG